VKRIDKHWLSQLLNDSAFPVLALAVAVSQVHLGSHKKQNLYSVRQSAELRLEDRLQDNAAKYGSTISTARSAVAERIASNEEDVHH
jgi:hypothetical protein